MKFGRVYVCVMGALTIFNADCWRWLLFWVDRTRKLHVKKKKRKKDYRKKKILIMFSGKRGEYVIHFPESMKKISFLNK